MFDIVDVQHTVGFRRAGRPGNIRLGFYHEPRHYVIYAVGGKVLTRICHVLLGQEQLLARIVYIIGLRVDPHLVKKPLHDAFVRLAVGGKAIPVPFFSFDGSEVFRRHLVFDAMYGHVCRRSGNWLIRSAKFRIPHQRKHHPGLVVARHFADHGSIAYLDFLKHHGISVRKARAVSAVRAHKGKLVFCTVDTDIVTLPIDSRFGVIFENIYLDPFQGVHVHKVEFLDRIGVLRPVIGVRPAVLVKIYGRKFVRAVYRGGIYEPHKPFYGYFIKFGFREF